MKLAVVVAAVLVVACAAPTPVAPTPTSRLPSPSPGASLGQFDCQLPVARPATAQNVHLTDITISGEAGFDRLTLEFDSGLPAVEIKQAQPPFTTDPAGLPLEVGGNDFVQMTLRGASRGGGDGPITYDGPTNFTPYLSELLELHMAGDSEGVMTFIAGLDTPPCFGINELDGPARLVIDWTGQ